VTHLSVRRRFAPALPALLLAAAGLAWAAAGNLDPSFGTGGVVVTPALGNATIGLVVQADGKTVVCGSQAVGGVDPTGHQRSAWLVRRYNTDGTDDASFGTGGAVALFGDGFDGARRVAIDASGRLVIVGKTSVFVVGRRSVTATYYLTLVRLNANGSLDTSFGSSGVVRILPPGSAGSTAGSNPAGGLVLQPDGSIVVAGQTWMVVDKKGTTIGYPFLARYTAGGTVDASFGSGGFSIDTRTAEGASPVALARQSSGHHVLAQRRSSVTWVITRYLPSGAVDTAFAPILGSGDYVGGLAVDRFDRILATGRNTYANGQYDVLVSRYTSSGAADGSFGSGGRALVHSSYNQNCWADPILQLADDKIVVGANLVTSAGYGVAATLRLLDDGSLDATYGTGGVSDTLDLGRGQTSSSAVGFAPDGRIVHTGQALGTNGWNWLLARFDVN